MTTGAEPLQLLTGLAVLAGLLVLLVAVGLLAAVLVWWGLPRGDLFGLGRDDREEDAS